MDDIDDINFQKAINEEKKKNKECKYKQIQLSKKFENEITKNNNRDNTNYFRKKYMNEKIRNPNINRTLNDIYETINSINTINKKIYKIFYKRKNTKEISKNSNASGNIKTISIQKKIINEYKNKPNKSNKTKHKKTLKRSNFSYDNIMTRNVNFSLINDKASNPNKPMKNEDTNKIDDRSILYISSYISEELDKNKINNKLNYDYNDLHLKERLNKYKNKLKRNQTCDNILDLNYFRNSKNIKDIILLEKYKQNEYQKLESIKNLKKQYLKDMTKEQWDSKQIKNINNSKVVKDKPFCFNDNIDKINKPFSVKNNNTSSFINENFLVNDEKENNIWNQNSNTNIINKLNYNYGIYRNILHNN